MCVLIFFFNDTATTEIYTLSLHDALPILAAGGPLTSPEAARSADVLLEPGDRVGVLGAVEADLEVQVRPERESRVADGAHERSEEHTSELQSRQYIVCRLLLEKNKVSVTI